MAEKTHKVRVIAKKWGGSGDFEAEVARHLNAGYTVVAAHVSGSTAWAVMVKKPDAEKDSISVAAPRLFQDGREV